MRICWSGITRGRVSKSTLQMDHIGDLAIKQSAVNSLRTGRPGPYAGWGGSRGSIVKFSPSLMRTHAYNNYMRKFSPPCCMKIGIGLCYICDLPLYGRQFPMQRSPLYDRRFPPPPPQTSESSQIHSVGPEQHGEHSPDWKKGIQLRQFRG